MQRGLEGRRVALYVGSLTNESGVGVQTALERAGARVHVLTSDADGEDFRGGVYAALVAIAGAGARGERAPILQLVRECMASDKPVAALGDGVELIIQAGGAAGRRLAADPDRRANVESAGATLADGASEIDDALVTAASSVGADDFASTVVRVFAERLDERAVDEMSELSFPASDPPAVTPSTLGSDHHGEAR